MVSIREARPDEWREARALRLDMLEDSPMAYHDDLAAELGRDDRHWQVRHASRLMSDSVLVVAVRDDGTWLGQMAGREYVEDDGPCVWVLEVYLRPDARSRGTAGDLLEAVEDWARDRGHRRMVLDVHEHAAAARRFYARAGFLETGRRRPHPRDARHQELEMAKDLP